MTYLQLQPGKPTFIYLPARNQYFGYNAATGTEVLDADQDNNAHCEYYNEMDCN